MGLRCLLGHDFDEPELQREREEDGNEVVTTVTEVKTCARCGETQIVSENTEVTTIEQLTDEATVASAEAIDAGNGAGRHGRPEEGAAGERVDEPEAFGAVTDGTQDGVDAAGGANAAAEVDAAGGDGDDAVIIEDEPRETTTEATGPTERSAEATGSDAEGAGDESADGEPETAEGFGPTEDDGAELLDEGAPEASTDTALGGDYEEYPGIESEPAPTDGERNAERDAETDDGVILDETREPDDDRKRGAWPEVDRDEAPGTEPTPWPEQEGDDEGYSAEVGDSDGSDGVEFGGGLTPKTAEGSGVDDDAEYVEAPERGSAADAGVVETETGRDENSDVGVGITHGESPDIGPATADVTMEYYCPECEMTRDADGNSMRAGDICPECKLGYVTERPVGN